MYGLIPVPDHKIIAINRAETENEATEIIYKDKHSKLHRIDLDTCVENFQGEYGNKNGRCIGDRNITQGYFLLYTRGAHTKVSFKRLYIINISGKRLFKGRRNQRFAQFQDLLSQMGYTTYDLS